MPRYEMREFVISEETQRASRLLRRYFQLLTSDTSIPKNCRNWMGWNEYVTAAIDCTVEIERLMFANEFVWIGSDYLDSSERFAAFGHDKNFDEYMYTFERFSEVLDHYESNACAGKNAFAHMLPVERKSKSSTSITDLFHLADDYQLQPLEMLQVCLLLTKDVVVNAGPDCEFFARYITNDSRTNRLEEFDIDEWENLRCRAFGRFGEITRTRPRGPVQKEYSTSIYRGSYTQTSFSTVKRNRKCEPKLDLVYSGNDLLSGLAVVECKADFVRSVIEMDN